jgi:hypothetical protein
MSPLADHTRDKDTLADLAQRFSFIEIRKRSLQARFFFVLCATISDKDTLLNCGDIILPMGQMSLYVTVTPSVDDTISTFLPREIRLALRSHKSLFYQGDIVLSVPASIPMTLASLFQTTLLTLP